MPKRKGGEYNLDLPGHRKQNKHLTRKQLEEEVAKIEQDKIEGQTKPEKKQRSRSEVNIHPTHRTHINMMAIEERNMTGKEIHTWLMSQTHPQTSQKYSDMNPIIKYEAVQRIVREARKNSKPDLDEKINWLDHEKIKSFGIRDVNLSRCRAVIGALKGKLLSSIPLGSGMIQAGRRWDFKEDYRWLKWADYVITYAGEDIKENLDIWIIAKVFANREKEFYYSDGLKLAQYKTILDGDGLPLVVKRSEERAKAEPTMEMQDLDDWLDYRPWVSKENEDIYRDAIANGQATKLRFKVPSVNLPRTGVVQMHQSSKDVPEPVIGFYLLAAFLWGLTPTTNWLLPSQQLQDFCEAENKEKLWLVFNFAGVIFGWRFDPVKKGKSDTTS